jgi:CHAD domain-containing protein
LDYTETLRFAHERADRGLAKLAFHIHQNLRPHNPEAVHDLRVAIRRFSQTLRVFKPCFRGKEMRKVRRELKRIMDLAGEVRNCDVSLKLLSKSQKSATATLRSKLEGRRRECERAFAGILRHWIDRKSAARWRAAVKDAITTSTEPFGRAPIAKTAQRILPGVAQEFFARGNQASTTKTPPAQLHRFRIASKKFRYTLELFASLYGPGMNSSLDKIRRAQALLGEINDCETVRSLVSRWKSADGLMSWIRKRQRRKIDEFQRYWEGAFGSDREMRSWGAFLRRPIEMAGLTKKPAARVGLSQAASRRSTAVA